MYDFKTIIGGYMISSGAQLLKLCKEKNKKISEVALEYQLEEMAQFEYDIAETLKELKELKKITREPTKRERLDKAIRINQQTGKLDYCKEPKVDYKEKFLPDYGVLIQADNLINSLSVMKELGDKKVTFYLHKEKFYLPIAIHSESVKGLVGAIRYK